jgi:hypothetical protein
MTSHMRSSTISGGPPRILRPSNASLVSCSASSSSQPMKQYLLKEFFADFFFQKKNSQNIFRDLILDCSSDDIKNTDFSFIDSDDIIIPI